MKKISITIAMAWMSITLSAQNNDTKKADKLYSRFEYIDAIDSYLKLTEKGKEDSYVQKQLAEAYRLTSNTAEAEKWYAKVVKNDTDAENYFWYSQILKANGKTKESKTWMEKFATANPKDSRAIAFKKNPDYLGKLLAQPEKFKVEKTALNTEFSDFGAFQNNGKVYFASARNTSGKTYGWNKQPTLDIYVANSENGNFTDIKPLEGDVNTKFNEGSVAISADGTKMYFTRTNYFEGKYEKDKEGVSNLKIFTAQKNGENWQNIKSLPFNSDAYSTGHPALSPDGKTLYFASNMPSGFGKTDLYKVAINADGSFGKPENLGETINTSADEQFPFIGKDGTLYFSSNGHLGLGGLDVFYVKPVNGNFTEVINIGKPINSAQDDFSFFIDDTTSKGFVSSSRNGGSGSDDIYSISLIPSKPEVNPLPVEKSAVAVKTIEEEVIAFEPANFEFDSNEITPESASKLDKIVEVMKKFPSLEIKINSYSDNIGSQDYNLKLSKKRAKATVDYIVSKGISKNRISGEGFGSANQKVNCSDCTPKQNIQNRRSEFIIIKK